MAKVTTEDLMMVDHTTEGGKATIQKALHKIGPFAKYDVDEDVPLEKLEKFVKAMVLKYEITPQWIFMEHSISDKGIMFSVGIKTTDTHQWLGTVRGVSLYETFAKLVIKMYAEIRSGKIPKK